MNEFLCTRELTYGTTGEESRIVVNLGRPQQIREQEYICAFQITGIADSHVRYAHGIDCLQSLIMALEGIRVTLERAGGQFTWQGGEKGDHGFPRFVPLFYGRDFSKHLEQIIEREVTSFAEMMQKESRRV